MPLDLLSTTAAAQALSVVPGAAAISLDLLSGMLEALELIVSVEGVDVAIDLAVLVGEMTANVLAVAPGQMTISLDMRQEPMKDV